MFHRWTLARQFFLASLAILLLNGFVVGFWITHQIEQDALHNASDYAALYANSVVSRYLQGLSASGQLPEASIAGLDQIMNTRALKEQIVAFKIWSLSGEILYSPNQALIGRRFGIDDDLATALKGDVATSISDLADPENEFERQHWSRLQSTYVPVRAESGGQVIAVTEFYQLTDRLDSELWVARLHAWAIVAGVTLITYLLLAGLVGRGSRLIVKQEHVLRDRVTELSHLLEQNRALHERVRQAAGRTTTLNEQALRRVSSDLHDGPGQALALALLRMDAVAERTAADKEFVVIEGAIRDALGEIRSISAGLRLPELEALSVREVVERVVRDHCRRSAGPVDVEFGMLLLQAPLPVTIALYRTLQEALSNATRHGDGQSIMVRVWQEKEQLFLVVVDHGPGIVAQVDEDTDRQHLGLDGMRERAQLLGGEFVLDSRAGEGTTVKVWWPLTFEEEEWSDTHSLAAAI